MKKSASIIVSGIVQGVGFRWFVEREANKLQLCGWVKNLSNGNVAIEVEGDDALIRELIRTVKIGNRSSHVTGVEVEWGEFRGNYSSFSIRF